MSVVTKSVAAVVFAVALSVGFAGRLEAYRTLADHQIRPHEFRALNADALQRPVLRRGDGARPLVGDEEGVAAERRADAGPPGHRPAVAEQLLGVRRQLQLH